MWRLISVSPVDTISLFHVIQDCISVGCVPPLVARISQHALCQGGGGGCLLRGGPASGLWGVWSGGVPASGPGGVYPSMQWGRPPPL